MLTFIFMKNSLRILIASMAMLFVSLTGFSQSGFGPGGSAFGVVDSAAANGHISFRVQSHAYFVQPLTVTIFSELNFDKLNLPSPLVNGGLGVYTMSEIQYYPTPFITATSNALVIAGNAPTYGEVNISGEAGADCTITLPSYTRLYHYTGANKDENYCELSHLVFETYQYDGIGLSGGPGIEYQGGGMVRLTPVWDASPSDQFVNILGHFGGSTGGTTSSFAISGTLHTNQNAPMNMIPGWYNGTIEMSVIYN
jgi:hypothetical protein